MREKQQKRLGRKMLFTEHIVNMQADVVVRCAALAILDIGMKGRSLEYRESGVKPANTFLMRGEAHGR